MTPATALGMATRGAQRDPGGRLALRLGKALRTRPIG